MASNLGSWSKQAMLLAQHRQRVATCTMGHTVAIHYHTMQSPKTIPASRLSLSDL